MRAIVTGAAGFIGSALVDRLLKDGHQVVGIDNLSTGKASNLEHALDHNMTGTRRFTFLRLDIQAPELTGIVAGANPKVIFHLAAQVNPKTSVTDPQFDARNNVLGTINVCEASRQAGVQKIVYAAEGVSRYGRPDRQPVNEAVQVKPPSTAAAGKVAGEMYLHAYAEMYGLEPICLALASVYGPRQHGHGATGVIGNLARAAITGAQVGTHGDGATAHDYVYVDDVVEAFVHAGTISTASSGTYNIGTGQRTPASVLHRLISAVVDGTAPPCLISVLSRESQEATLDVTKAEKELGWSPSVDLVEGIRRTISWLRATSAGEAEFTHTSQVVS